MKKTSTDSATPSTFDEYMDLNTYQDDLAQIGINPAEWNADNFLDDRKYMNRAREILRTNPNISPVDAEMKIIAIRAAIRKCAITDVEKREAYNTELHAYKLLKDWLMNNYRGNKKMKNVSENKNMKKNAVKINESTLRQIVAESVKKVLKERFVPNGESEYNDENWNNEQENIMCFDLFAGSSFGLSDDERSEILTATLFDRYDKAVGRLNDLHVKYNADTNRLIGSV